MTLSSSTAGTTTATACSRKHAIGRGRGGKRSSSDAGLLGALERSIADNQGLPDVVLEVAQRIDSRVEAENAPRLVGTADPAGLDAVLRRDSLWARLWPHVEREPIVPDLNERERRRFANLVAARAGSMTRGLLSEPVVRRAEDLIEAHAAEPGEPAQCLVFDGIEYVGFRPVRDGGAPRRFFRVDAPGVIVVSWSTDPACWFPDFGERRSDYGGMRAAGLFDLPVLSCPKEWGAEISPTPLCLGAHQC